MSANLISAFIETEGPPSDSWLLDVLDHCPCWNDLITENGMSLQLNRRLEEKAVDGEPWEKAVVSIVLFVTLGVLVVDKIGPDWALVTALLIFMAFEIINIDEGLAGFANEGVLTVMALFVLAEGVSRTGALDHYMGKLLGTPSTAAGAQVRLTFPVAILSAFLNNTPIVAVMIPMVLRWSKRIGVSKQQLLIPLSYATILGGTCTLVGTSTNLVVAGLLKKAFPDDEAGNIGLFDLAVFGVPNALIGLAYMLAFSPFLLPSGKGKGSAGSGGNSGADALLFGARVKAWSPAAGRTYKRSGLGNSGGIFLTNVRRAATGNVHTAVSKDFVISAGDELYFTGLIELFGEFCEKNGLEIITTENVNTIPEEDTDLDDITAKTSDGPMSPAAFATSPSTVARSKEKERMRFIRHLSDQIAGREPVDTEETTRASVVVSLDETEQAVLVGVDCHDRPGLLMDITEALSRVGLNLRHSEAKVIGDRSISVWGCEPIDQSSTSQELEEIWGTVSGVLLSSDQATASKRKAAGTKVVRAIVPPSSSLVGKKPVDVEFRKTYMASIIAYQKNGKNCSLDIELGVSDLLVLETMDGSPLLTLPPTDFYDKLERNEKSEGLYDKFQRSVSRRSNSDPNLAATSVDVENDVGTRREWRDLRVVFGSERQEHVGVPTGEFLTAFVVTAKSPILNKSLVDVGYSKLPGVVLINVERPTSSNTTDVITSSDPLQAGDIIWYSGSAEDIADLQKLQGVEFYRDEQLKAESKVELTERRLVQAVIAKGSPLVGQTIKGCHFRSVYGGVVVAIQRGSERVHELPANVKLQTGDVLLVEAGSTFVENQGNNYRTFALVSEVENSSPPRPRLFLLCALMIVASLAVAGSGIRSLLITASFVGIAMVSLGVVTQQEARDCIQWDLFVAIASAFGISKAMENSGVSADIARFLVDLGTKLNIGGMLFDLPWICALWSRFCPDRISIEIFAYPSILDAGIYGSVYIAGNILTAILTNNAAAALMFGIAMDTVALTGVDRLKMCYVLMLCSSCYITSFGYQTNLMVYGPGQYSNLDFFKFGGPMQVLLFLSTVAMVSTLSVDDPKWVISWIVCAAGFIVVAGFRLTGGMFLRRKEQKEG